MNHYMVIFLCTIMATTRAFGYVSKSGHYEENKGHRRLPPYYSDSNVQSYIECAMKCLNEPGCQAVNYW